jgi:hypothetical protein
MSTITKDYVQRLCESFSNGSRTTDAASDLWVAALRSLLSHWDNALLKTRTIITLVDFRLPATDKRLWVFQLHPDLSRLVEARVSHGRGSDRDNDGRVEKKSMGNEVGSEKSSIGAFVTLDVYQSKAGKLGTKADGTKKAGIALRIEGLEAGVNDNVKARAVVFHGATYVTSSKAGRSEGCFATEPAVNKQIIDLIKGGTFVYAYAG